MSSHEKITAMIEANLIPALEREAEALEKHVKHARANDEHIVLSDVHVAEVVALLKHAKRRIESLTPSPPTDDEIGNLVGNLMGFLSVFGNAMANAAAARDESEAQQ